MTSSRDNIGWSLSSLVYVFVYICSKYTQLSSNLFVDLRNKCTNIQGRELYPVAQFSRQDFPNLKRL